MGKVVLHWSWRGGSSWRPWRQSAPSTTPLPDDYRPRSICSPDGWALQKAKGWGDGSNWKEKLEFKKESNIQSRTPELQGGGGGSRAWKEEFVLNIKRRTSHSEPGEKESRTEVDKDSYLALRGRALRVFIAHGLSGKVICWEEIDKVLGERQRSAGVTEGHEKELAQGRTESGEAQQGLGRRCVFPRVRS